MSLRNRNHSFEKGKVLVSPRRQRLYKEGGMNIHEEDDEEENFSRADESGNKRLFDS
jgi:hypothetical protein